MFSDLFMKAVGLVVLSTSLSACSCLESATIAGTATAGATGGLASLSPNVTVNMKDCCPNEENKKDVGRLEDISFKLADLYVSGKMSKDAYVEQQELIRKLVDDVKESCPVATRTGGPAAAPNDLWKRIKKYNEETSKLLN